MAPRLTVALAVGAVACAALAGCAEDDTSTAPVSPSRYVAAVEALLDPPSRLAGALSERAGRTDVPAPSRRRLDGLVAEARDRLADLRALRLEDPGLRAQRGRLAAAYARLIPRMQAVVDALAARVGPAGLRAASRPFLDALRALPSAASSSSR